MYKKILPFAGLILSIVWLFFSCAKVGSLSGGQKDTTPPKMDSLHSTRNFQTNFSGKRIEIEFDEWLKLDRPNEQILMSPLLYPKPEIKLKGKKIIVQLPENQALKPNTTYVLNFGNAVQDFHEGNPVKDLRYVFSTGAVIDSLKISGTVVDAFSGQPLENMTVMLFDSPADSAIRKSKAFYFAKTDKLGNFLLENLRSGAWQMVAVEDLNLSYNWNDGEKIGFLDQITNLPDSAISTVSMRLFTNLSAQKIVGNDSKIYGLARIFLTSPPAGLRPIFIENTPQLIDYEEVNDSIYIWYDGATLPFSMIFGRDTVRVKPASKVDFLKKNKLTFADDIRPPTPTKRGRGGDSNKKNESLPTLPVAQNDPKIISQNPQKPIELLFNRPVVLFDTTLIILVDDSLKIGGKIAFTYKKDTISPRKWLLDAKFRAGTTKKLVIFPGGITDIYGEKNADTMIRRVVFLPENQLGSMTVIFKNLQAEKSFLFELLIGEQKIAQRTFRPNLTGENRFLFAALPIGEYNGRLIEDANENGRWDAGNFDEKRQPEIIFRQNFDALKPQWEQEVEFSLEAKSKKRISTKR
jgi:Bacterial Ig-like domain